MFTPEPSIAYVPATREQVVSILEAINQPQVSIPGRPSQAVQGYLCSLRNSNGSFSIVLVLHLPATGENVVYLHDQRQLSAEEFRPVQQEGLQFLESMGFILDNLNFRNLSGEQQEQVIRRIPLFSPPRPAAAAAGATAVTAAEVFKVARILASF